MEEGLTNQKTILIADDHPAIRVGIKWMLKDHYNVLEAENAQQAIEIYNTEEIDLFICDLVMPGLGINAIKKIREIDDRILIVIYTATDHKDMIRQVMKEKIDGLILKESAPPEVIDNINSVMKGVYVVPRFVEKLREEEGSWDLEDDEIKIIKMVVEESASSAKIASTLKVKIDRVNYLRKKIIQKLHVKDIYQAYHQLYS